MLKLAAYLFEMGCPINTKKSILVPQSSVQYLGLKISFSPLTTSVPADKRAKLAAFDELIRDLPIVSKRATARLKGYFMFSVQALKLPLSPINVATPLNISSCISSALAMIRAFPSFNLTAPSKIFAGNSIFSFRSNRSGRFLLESERYPILVFSGENLTSILSANDFRLPQNVTSHVMSSYQLRSCSAHSISLTDSSERVSIGNHIKLQCTLRKTHLSATSLSSFFIGLFTIRHESLNIHILTQVSPHLGTFRERRDVFSSALWFPASAKYSGYLALAHDYASGLI